LDGAATCPVAIGVIFGTYFHNFRFESSGRLAGYPRTIKSWIAADVSMKDRQLSSAMSTQ
jgi:hypothetical protein